MRRSWRGLTFMVVHSKLRRSEVREGPWIRWRAQFWEALLATIRARVPRTVCTMAHGEGIPAAHHVSHAKHANEGHELRSLPRMDDRFVPPRGANLDYATEHA